MNKLKRASLLTTPTKKPRSKNKMVKKSPLKDEEMNFVQHNDDNLCFF